MNSRLDTLQAAVLLAKLEILDDELAARQRIATRYGKLLSGCNDGRSFRDSGATAPALLEAPYIEPHNISAWAQFTIRVPDRVRLQQALQDAGIGTAIHYPLPLNKQPAVADASADLPRGDLAAEQVVSLPMHPYLEETVQSRIVECLLQAASAC